VGVQWTLLRNCSITPKQLGWVYLSLCGLSLAIAAPFALNGAVAVLAFAGVELLAVGVAMLIYARHVCDGDRLTLRGHCLRVEQVNGRHTAQTEFRAEWVSVEPAHGAHSLVEIAGNGHRIRVGRFLRPELRPALAHELRLALRMALADQTPALSA
jgi:uncharacterized membrane protein